ncbi:MAG: TIGR03960 family B12-binding radical SAM protein [Candidatus Aminicenantes bacterium]
MRDKKNLENILRQVEKPGRYVGGEWNQIKKDPQKARVKIALVFPDVYEIGMSYLGQKILYHILNSQPFFLAERVFAPWIDFEQKLRSKKIPLFSLENRIPLPEFDVLGFSLLYELNYSNILTILELGRVPFFSKERSLDHPLVLGGGPAVFNPEPVADIFDLFLIGDGEEAFVEIVEKFMNLRNEHKDKMTLLKEMAKIKGSYVPSFYTPYQPSKSSLLAVKPHPGMPKKVEKRILYPFHKAPFPEEVIVPNVKVVFDRVAVEVERGCPQKCRFCQAASIYFPPRTKSPSYVLHNVLNSLHLTGYEDASLASLSVSDYPYLDDIVEILMDRLKEKKISLSLSSLRPRGLSAGVAKNILKVRKTGFTLVPEAGTERLRRVINKDLNDQDIWEASKTAFFRGWRLLKLYFMVGLPSETDGDLEGIVNMVEEIIRMGYKSLKSAPRINLSISSFIPKPHTPFQWLEMQDEKILEEKHRFIKSRLKKYPSVKFKDHSLKSSLLEAVFSRGDRRLNQILVESWKRGSRFDSWKDLFRFPVWSDCFESKELDYHLYLQALNKNEILPWDHVDTGIKKSHLFKELEKALEQKTTASCLETPCQICDGCSLTPQFKHQLKENIRIPGEKDYSLGKKRGIVFRYRAGYSKQENARYLSHIDLNNIIQRSFRRAGIRVAHSQGFHPKMLFSYPPALALGMEGREEVLEFKSCYLIEQKEFLSCINRYLPSGLKFLSLKRMEDHHPSLHKDLKTLVYSVDTEDSEIKEALDKKESDDLLGFEERITKRVDDFIEKTGEVNRERVFFDSNSRRLFIYQSYSGQKSIRPQDMVREIFGIQNPVFVMTREKILFEGDL